MENRKINLRFSIISTIILLTAISRLIPHLPNFAPTGGIALFSAAYYNKRYWSFIMPITIIWISDLIINNIVCGQHFDYFVRFYNNGLIFIYIGFTLIILSGMLILKKVCILNLIVSILSASIIFFLVSNFGIWFSSGIYPYTFDGLQTCYSDGIPFFKNILLGNITYTTLLFGVFELLQYHFSILKL